MAFPVEITVSRHFLTWLHDERVSLALTTYQANRLVLLGLKPDGRLSIFERLFDRPMGLHATAETLHMTTRYQLWRFENALPAGYIHEGYDRIYVPRAAHTTGDVDAHDVELDRDGRLIFINTAYSCLATPGERHSFKPLWRPPFISRLAPEDRCHLNGLAMEAGVPAYVTTVSRSDVASGWRDRREAGGCLIDVRTDELLLREMSMPHSPRRHSGKTWLLEAGKGELGYLDERRGAFEPVAFCPGFVRGLSFHREYALVGLSKPRRDNAFQGLELDRRLASKDSDAHCGVHVIDTRTGNAVHWLRIEGVVAELYDVKVLPGVRRPMALGFRNDEIQRLITIDLPEGPFFEALPLASDCRSDGESPVPGLPLDVQPAPQGALKTVQADTARRIAESPALAPLGPSVESPAAERDVLAEARRARQEGRTVEAERLYQKVLGHYPGSTRAHYGLANLLVAQDRIQEAVPHYEAVVNAEPGHARALLNLGTIRYRTGEIETAIDLYRRSIDADPKFPKAYRNLSIALQSDNRPGDAVALYDDVLQRYPGDADLQHQAGLACCESGLLERALEHFRRAVELAPEMVEAHNQLGSILALMGQQTNEDGPALAHYRRAVEIEPDFAPGHRNIGVILEDRGQTEQAAAAYRRALQLEPDGVLELHTATLFPFVAPSNEAIDAYRAGLPQILDSFLDRALRMELGGVQSSRGEPPLHWAYQGREDHELKRRWAGLFSGTPFPKRVTRAAVGDRIHIGFVASLGHEALFMRCMAGVLNRLPRERFRLTVICPRSGEAIVRACLVSSDVQCLTLPLRFDQAINSISDARCDVLYYWETGTDSTNYFLPFCRLAPVQCTGWGWPITSGAPEMDYYLSSEALTTPESDAHYTERLVRLPSLTTYFERLPFPAEPPSRSSLGLPEDGHLYVCLQNLRKVHPDFDPMLGAILRGDPAGVAVFVSDVKSAVTKQLKERWRHTLPDLTARILMLPRLPGMDYCRLVMLADVVLDTVHFGGANTAYDAFGAGKPVVTLPNAYQRGRYTYACYRVMGMTECIASTPEEYAAIAVRLGTDADWRADIGNRIREQSRLLFDSSASVPELTEFFERAVAASRG